MPSKRSPEEQAAYMRDYRARKAHAKVEGQKDLAIPAAKGEDPSVARITNLVAENVRLVEEVRVLKAELAKRPILTPARVPASVQSAAMAALPSMERPVAENLESLFAAPIRAMSQSDRDAVLRKVSTTKVRDR